MNTTGTWSEKAERNASSVSTSIARQPALAPSQIRATTAAASSHNVQWVRVRRRTREGSDNLLAGATTLDTGLLQQLAMLLLGHSLASLLDDRAHFLPFDI